MANPTLHWRMLAPVQIQNNGSISSFLDALYQAGTATTYADGTTRTPGTFSSPGTASTPASLGTGSAWTWNYDATTFGTGGKTALYGYPPTTTAINQVAILGATSSVVGAVWKQMSTDTRSANYIFAGLAKNAGTYTSWNNATTPFTVGDFTGFGVASITGTTNYTYVLMWESEEAVAIQIVSASSPGVSTILLGAWLDPLSANTLNAETDGRLYGVSTTGSSALMSTAWLSVTAAATGPLLYNVVTGNECHTYTFTPGAGTIVAMQRFGTFVPTTTLTSRNGDLPQIPFQVWSTTTGQYYGQLRQMNITRDGATGTEWQVGTVVKGYLLSASPFSANDAVILTY